MDVIKLVERLFAEYGYLLLILGLPVDAIALPIPPGNTTLAYTGYMVYENMMGLVPALLSAYAGALIGITITYWIGLKLGNPLIERYGKWIFLKPAAITKTRDYYKKYGSKLLVLGPFIPGVRQVIGYASGIIGIPFRKFALYAYIGSALWVLVFFSIGYLFGDHWQAVFAWIEKFFLYFCLSAGALLVLFIGIKMAKWQRARRRQRQRG
ncbi:DedA family protein [Paenibacillus sp. CAA11]|uniref:DedA family protein n=1 Tax=Paenibacillus sp. CAA11 TaxID=1532905 RepID=UPI000D34A82D|nr:DedA family protein [Paenibacillus sp. CAA11]AWB46802.1 DedA family protein [Paenibacillus sp. CAA11]